MRPGPAPRAACPVCRRSVALRVDGTLRAHGPGRAGCAGVGARPDDPVAAIRATLEASGAAAALRRLADALATPEDGEP